MKAILDFLKRFAKPSCWVVAYLGFMILLWWLPPFLPDSWAEFLSSRLNRSLILLTTSAIIWLVYEYYLNRRQILATQPADLIQQFQVAMRTLKTKKIVSPFDASAKRALHLPWLLTLGALDSGKVAIIRKAGLKSMADAKATQSGHYFEYYITREAVIFDTASKLMDCEDDQKAVSLWRGFLQNCRYYHRSLFNGVMIHLSIQQLMSAEPNQLKQILSHHKRQLQQLNQCLSKPTPTFICINHMDSISGFNAFFAGLDPKEHEQPWGILFEQSHFSDLNDLCERFDQQYDILVQKLHNQLVSKLHQEAQYDKRCLMTEFPVQIEAIKRSLARIVQYLSDCFINPKCLQLQGIFFTGTGESEERVDRLLSSLNKTFTLTTTAPNITDACTAYFIRGLYTQVIFPCIWQQQQQLNWYYRYPNFRYMASWGMASTTMILCIIIWTHQLSHNIQTIEAIQQDLSRYFNHIEQHGDSVSDRIQAMNNLARAVAKLAEPHAFSFKQSLFKHESLIELAAKAYEKTVEAFLYRYLTETLENILTHPQKNSGIEIYQGLRFYLQLIRHQTIDVLNFESWLQRNNSTFKLNAKQMLGLRQHLQNFSNDPNASINVNLPLIAKSREQLFNLPSDELALIILLLELAYEIPDREISLKNINQIAPVLTKKTNLVIPGIYSQEVFVTTYEKLIPQAANIAMKGNWVTGKINKPIPNSQFIQEITDLYTRKYLDTWKTMFEELQLRDFTSYQHAIQVMDNFTNQNSPLYELLQILNYHTDIKYHGMSTLISVKFQEFHQLFDSYRDNNLYSLTIKVNKLKNLITAIANAPNSEKAAFILAKNRMLSSHQDIFDELEYLAITLPSPLRQWVLHLTQSSWQLVMQDAQSYINHAWEQQIVAYFNQKIGPYYPFNLTAPSEIKWVEFNQFFSQAGIFDKFYLDYLAPFVAQENGQLLWRKRNNVALGKNPQFLLTVSRLLAIRDTFFTKIPHEASLEFIVQPLAFQPIVKTTWFNIDNQQAQFSHYTQVPQIFTWPGQQALHMASLAIISIDGKQVKMSETGLWSLFRLLQHGKLQATRESNSIIVTFELAGYGVEFELSNQTNHNPFAPQLFTDIVLDAAS